MLLLLLHTSRSPILSQLDYDCNSRAPIQTVLIWISDKEEKNNKIIIKKKRKKEEKKKKKKNREKRK